MNSSRRLGRRARAARARRPDLRLLFLSGYPRGAVPNSDEMDAADHLLAKPFRKAELARELRRVLDLVG